MARICFAWNRTVLRAYFCIKRMDTGGVQENAGLLFPSEMSEVLNLANLLPAQVHPRVRVEPGKCGEAEVRVSR